MESQTGIWTQLGIDPSDLKSIKVAIMRRNVSEPCASGPLLRSVEDPADLRIHYRPDEGIRPIFDRDDIIVNKEDQEERMILAATRMEHEKSTHSVPSRSTSQSSQTSSDREPPKEEKKRSSPKAHTSNDHTTDKKRKDYYSTRKRRSNSHSRKAIYRSRYPPSRRSSSPAWSKRHGRSLIKERSPPNDHSKHRSSRSPIGYRLSPAERRKSKSPEISEKGKSLHKYRGPPEQRTRGRSRSYSPHYRRSRYSKSPHRHHGRTYDRSKRSRSRSPRRRYTPERHSKRSSRGERIYEPLGISNPYFESPEFWVPNPLLQPRFIPRQMLAPGFPYAFRPGISPMMPSRMPFRPRIVYNNRQIRSQTSQITPVGGSTVSTTTTGTSGENQNSQETMPISECALESTGPEKINTHE